MKKDNFDDELLKVFLEGFKHQFDLFVKNQKLKNACSKCSQHNVYCKGIDFFTGQKNCLSKKISSFNDEKEATGSVQTIDLWLSGRSTHLPNISLLKKVSLAMGCKLDDFFEYKIEENKNQLYIDELKKEILGNYCLYQFNQLTGKFSFGLMSLIVNPINNRIYAYVIFKWRDVRIMEDALEKLNNGMAEIEDIYGQNSYFGKAKISKDAIFIDVSSTQPKINDNIFIVIPNTIKFQENIAIQENKTKYDGKLLGGYGIITCLNNHFFREGLSIPFIFTKTSIPIDTDDVATQHGIKDIESGGGENTTSKILEPLYNKNLCITESMEESLVEYLMDDIE